MNQGIISKLMSVLEASLSKLSRYDEGSLIGSILSLTNVSGSGKDLGQGYVNFARNNMDQVRGKINDELWILNIFEQWYTAQINMLCNWLSERLDHSLHLYQCTCLSHIVKVTDLNLLVSTFLSPIITPTSPRVRLCPICCIRSSSSFVRVDVQVIACWHPPPTTATTSINCKFSPQI